MQSRASIVLIDWVCAFLLVISAGGCYIGGTQTNPSLEYTVKRGDTLYMISQRFGSSVEELRRVNRISDPRNLHVGQNLKVPVGTQSYRRHAKNRSAVGGGTNLPVKTARAPALRMVKLGPAQRHIRQMVWPLPQENNRIS
ncbi:MAG: LysM peptidoglycan-binding domain-containing protein [Deltaproteobacteria bacterium]|nr:LysM peptidoglycan-binding domain-containing protein [Deltaproteobacteria bacterium]